VALEQLLHATAKGFGEVAENSKYFIRSKLKLVSENILTERKIFSLSEKPQLYFF
jgi:hypothetical protein